MFIPYSVCNLISTGQARVSRRQVQNITICFKNVKIIQFGDHIWNHHEECIQTSTNMPSIGSKICEIGFEIEKI